MSANDKRRHNQYATTLPPDEVSAKIVAWADRVNSIYDASKWKATRSINSRSFSDLQIAVTLSAHHYFVSVGPLEVLIGYGKPASEVEAMVTPPKGALKVKNWSASVTFVTSGPGSPTIVNILLRRFFYGSQTGEMGGRSEFDDFIREMELLLTPA